MKKRIHLTETGNFHIGETDGERHEDPIVCDLDLAEV